MWSQLADQWDILLPALLTEQCKQSGKELDDVEIQSGCSKDVLLRRDLLHDHFDVDDDVQAEEAGCCARQTHVKQAVLQPNLPFTEHQHSVKDGASVR